MEALLGVEPSGRCQWELWGYITSILLTAGCWLNMMGYGACLREYIYIAAKMVAEYQPVDNKYYPTPPTRLTPPGGDE